jgi:hypothetical protein
VNNARVGLLALLLGVVVGARARSRGAGSRSEDQVALRLARDLAGVERRLTETTQRLDRDRRRTGALVLALALLIAVPTAAVSVVPDVPDVVVAGVLALALLAAGAAMVVAYRADHGTPPRR